MFVLLQMFIDYSLYGMNMLNVGDVRFRPSSGKSAVNYTSMDLKKNCKKLKF